MSRQNKANRNNYTQAGRLTPDEIARERRRQSHTERDQTRDQVRNRGAEGRPAPRAERAPTRRRTARAGSK
jgi:hypothetical protein